MALDASLTYEIVFTDAFWQRLDEHLFPGDDDEHGAIVMGSIARVGDRVRLLVRHVRLAQDGIDYVAGQRGYRMLTAEFVRDAALFCRDERLFYLAAHNHGGRDYVAFSSPDMASHERGYPALRAIVRGQIVGALVFAENAVAGDLWLPSGERAALERARVVGGHVRDVWPAPRPRPPRVSDTYDRQARLFGDRGQALLSQQRVGVVGLGGVGSLVSEYLSRLGVGELVLVDPDRVELTNVPRLVGSSFNDAETHSAKVDIAAREASRGSATRCVAVTDDIARNDVARQLAGCDYLFLAADTMQARLVFNAIVHQYLVPGVQMGAKVSVDRANGDVTRAYSVVRPVLPGRNCLLCNGLISASRLQEEALTAEERRLQRYVDEPELPAPSVITLNAVAAAAAVNDFLFRITELRTAAARDDYVYFDARTGESRHDEPRADADCSECGVSDGSRFARGDAMVLPTRP